MIVAVRLLRCLHRDDAEWQFGKQATGSNETTGSRKHNREGNPPDKSTPSENSNTSGNNNSNEHQRGEMNDQSNQFNDERCPGQLDGDGDGDETNLDELQAFSINLHFRTSQSTK